MLTLRCVATYAAQRTQALRRIVNQPLVMSVTWDMIVQVCECAVAALCAATYIILLFMREYSITLYGIR